MDGSIHVHPIRSRGTPIQVKLSGRIVATTMPVMAGLRMMIEEYAEAAFNLDLERVDFIDATGIDFLLALRTLVQDRGGHMQISSILPRIRHAMERSGVMRALLAPGPAGKLLFA